MSKERAAKVMQEIFSKGTYEGDLLGIKITDIGAALDTQFERVSDTPRTDALIYRKNTIEMQRHELLDLALALERELVAARAELAELREELNDRRKFAYAVEQALDGLKGDYVEIIKELRTDAWLSGVTAERERCARVCEEFYSVENIAQKCAAAIRKGDAVTKERKPVPEFELIEKWEGE